jgi:cohesin loading factor subunit SCC2
MTKLAVGPMNSHQLPYCSVNHFLYSLIRSSRVYRRGLISQLLKMFDNDSSSTSLTLEEQLYVADNLAYFPYQVHDEPLFLIEQIDLTISVSGSTHLQQFRDLLKQHLDYIDDDEGIEMKKIEKKLYNVSESIIEELNQCLLSSKSTMLLLLLKSHLKDVYYLNDTKIIEYDNTDSSKITDRPIVTRKINVNFEPKIILDTIKPLVHSDQFEKRRQLIKEFAEFKRYLLAFDNDIEDTIQSMSDLLPTSSSTPKGKKKGSNGSNRRRKVMIDSDDESGNEDF